MKHIPNTITLLNLFSGCLAILFVFQGALPAAAIAIAVAAIFDLLDGLLARLLHAYSAIGKELDSLADVVSFGLAPSFIAFSMMSSMPERLFFPQIAYIVFVMALASAYRLAKFNIDTEQTSNFIGMPTPANALFWACIAYTGGHKLETLHPYYIALLCIIFAYLLVCNIKMFSFKFKTFTWADNKMIYLFCAVALLAFIFFGVLGIALMVLLYPVFSIIHFRLQTKTK
ncbi:MAG: CDP-diacylglycerol--serine O-phosphatidyltransferase [Bacteroidales bacterium]